MSMMSVTFEINFDWLIPQNLMKFLFINKISTYSNIYDTAAIEWHPF